MADSMQRKKGLGMEFLILFVVALAFYAGVRLLAACYRACRGVVRRINAAAWEWEMRPRHRPDFNDLCYKLRTPDYHLSLGQLQALMRGEMPAGVSPDLRIIPTLAYSYVRLSNWVEFTGLWAGDGLDAPPGVLFTFQYRGEEVPCALFFDGRLACIDIWAS
jgi:hypothetical protein